MSQLETNTPENKPPQPKSSPQPQSPMRRVLGNLSLLVRGRGVAAVMTLSATAILARSLGPVEFGFVVLIQTYVLLIRGLFTFKQFEAIIKYGVPAHDAKEVNVIRRLIHISRKIDHYMSVTATMVALILVPIAGPLMGMEQDHVILLGFYSLILLSTGNRTDVGILRLLDRFDILGRQMALGSVVRLFGVLVAWLMDSSFLIYVAILGFAFVSEEIYLSWCGRREFKIHVGVGDNPKDITQAKMSEFEGLRPFLWITYWQSNLDLVPKHISVMIAGLLLGASEAGLFRLARQFSSVLSKSAVLIRQVVFLDLTRSWHQGDDNFKLIAYRTAFYGACVGLVFVVVGYFFGSSLLNAVVGSEYVAAAPVLTLMLLAATFELAASSLRSAAYAIGDADKVLRVSAVSGFVYLALFVLLSLWMGLIGAGIAASVSAAILPIAMIIFIKKGRYQKKKAGAGKNN